MANALTAMTRDPMLAEKGKTAYSNDLWTCKPGFKATGSFDGWGEN